MRAAPALLLAAALLVAGADTATAGSASVSQTTVRFATSVSEVNRVTAYADAGPGIVLEDAQNNIVPGAGCAAITTRRVRCGGPETTLLSVDLGGGDDSVTVRSSLPVRAELRGGPGNDILRSGPRDDLLLGGSGGDTASYVDRTEDITVTVGAGADDGRAGEGDDVREVEGVVGGSGFDSLTGSDTYGEILTGGPGDDRLVGGGGNDTLVGGDGHDLLEGGLGGDVAFARGTRDGSDTFRGGPGDDRADYRRRREGVAVDADGIADDGARTTGDLRFLAPLPPLSMLASPERDNILTDVESIRGGTGADVLGVGRGGGRADGGRGTDVLYGSPGRDSLNGESGFDRIVSRDRAPDVVNCGPQVDRVFARSEDSIAGNCEQRSVRVPLRATAVSGRLEAAGLRMRVTCPAQAYVRCIGTVRATTVRRLRRANGRLRTAPLGGARLLAQPGSVNDVVIPFGDAARALAERYAPLRVRVVVRGRDDAGPSQPTATILVLGP